jgi:hypothetical protein
MLRKIDSRIAANSCQRQQQQHGRSSEEKRLVAMSPGAMKVARQHQRAAGKEYKECRGMSRREGIAVMQMYTLDHGQYHSLAVLEDTSRTIGFYYDVFQYLHEYRRRELANEKEDDNPLPLQE